MAERRVDPEDGTAYTYDELSKYYAGKYKKKEIEQYWESCAPAKKGKQGSAAKAPAAKAKVKAKVKAKPAREQASGKAAMPAEALADALASMGKRCHPRGSQPELGYGTAGFRTKADLLDHVIFRMGALAALRSRSLGGKAVGVMITASHNPERDNGVKLVDPMGDMLAPEWEDRATQLANATDDELADVYRRLEKECGVDGRKRSTRAVVIIGRDTRASSPALAVAALDGAGVLQPASAWSLGVVSTPQLHYMVRCHNSKGAYGTPSLEGYFDKLVGAYDRFLTAVDAAAESKTRTKYVGKVSVDCANGVGALVMKDAMLLPKLREHLDCTVVNGGEGGLNEGCGADFVKVQQKAPAGVSSLAAGERGVVFDGDADRVVYFCQPSGTFRLLDGDRIATLLASYVSTQLEKCGLAKDLRLGIVQTAYANGASSAHVARQIPQENIVCAKTGVKHLHHAAQDMDVGVYFEANGHGTVIFSRKFVGKLRKAAKAEDVATKRAAELLLLLRDLINETVGDAFSDFLAVEAVLYALDMSAEDWLAEYEDLPNRQLKVSVKDRGVFETTNAERTCVKPEGLQAKIDELVAAAGAGARSFVRPSGTEDVVRVYAEAATSAVMEDLAKKVSQAVYDLAGGVGTRP
eukprot:TRINITY_DN14844_c0_g1_i1.p1 TRINITY_DN14844_c0_g1~~TRINITY_DN14844_c0_g1_i1.p1  ORF type:complete len:638 (+),score=190.40 TRINITY_DN14844_c0_g1_i1:84-1997(+)